MVPPQNTLLILCMEETIEILHQLVDGLSCDNRIMSMISMLTKSFQLVQDFFHPQYVNLG